MLQKWVLSNNDEHQTFFSNKTWPRVDRIRLLKLHTSTWSGACVTTQVSHLHLSPPVLSQRTIKSHHARATDHPTGLFTSRVSSMTRINEVNAVEQAEKKDRDKRLGFLWRPWVYLLYGYMCENNVGGGSLWAVYMRNNTAVSHAPVSVGFNLELHLML